MQRRKASRGFTVTELMIALTIIGILLAIGLPGYFAFVQSTRAAQAVADLQAIRAAVYLYYGDVGRWPPEAKAGDIPFGLQYNLPKAFSMQRANYTLDYENWVGLHRRGMAPSGTETVVGVSIVSTDPRFLERVDHLIRDAKFDGISPTKYTLQIATMDGF